MPLPAWRTQGDRRGCVGTSGELESEPGPAAHQVIGGGVANANARLQDLSFSGRWTSLSGAWNPGLGDWVRSGAEAVERFQLDAGLGQRIVDDGGDQGEVLGGNPLPWVGSVETSQRIGEHHPVGVDLVELVP